MPFLTVRIVGICCLLDPREKDSFKKRIVLPTDHGMKPGGSPHIPYVEFESKDVASSANLSPEYNHVRGDVLYRRFTFKGSRRRKDAWRIGIDPIDTTAGFTVIKSFASHVPAMTEVCSVLNPHPRAKCFHAAPPRHLVSAFFDISHGTLLAGPLDEHRTRFVPSDYTTLGPIRLPHSVELLLPVRSSTPVVTFTHGRRTIRVRLKKGADQITLGNQLEADISGTGTVDYRHHFMLYYSLADRGTVPKHPPLPDSGHYFSLVNACSPTNWP